MSLKLSSRKYGIKGKNKQLVASKASAINRFNILVY
jgi:hypothetical protein